MPSEKNDRPKEYCLSLDASEAAVFECCTPAARAAAQATSWPYVDAYVKYANPEDWHPELGSVDIHMIWVGFRIVIRVDTEIDGQTVVFYVAEVN